MGFDWREYLNLGRVLQGERGVSFQGEPAFRSAVSRAYYAAFCSTRNQAVRCLGFTISSRQSVHFQLRKFLTQTGYARTAQDLAELQRWREKCDYEDVVSSSDLRVMFRAAIQRAEDIISSLP